METTDDDMIDDFALDFDPFAKPIKKEIIDRLEKEENEQFKDDLYREEAPPREEVKKSTLKSVYCNYRGRVTVYDIHGQKVHELSGMLDYEKYVEIESRSDSNITEFDGIEDYRRIGSELKRNVIINDNSGSIGSIDFSDFDISMGEPRDGDFSAPDESGLYNDTPPKPFFW